MGVRSVGSAGCLCVWTVCSFLLPQRWERTFEVSRHGVTFAGRPHLMFIVCIGCFLKVFYEFLYTTDVALWEGL